MNSLTLDVLDRRLAHALQIDGRAQFSRIAEVLGVSDSTVARRYHRLSSAGVLRVVASMNLSRLGYVPWTIRLQCTPDAAGTIASALARRGDTFWVHLLSGGTEISCSTQMRAGGGSDTLLLHKLSRTTRVVSVSAHSMLQGFASPSQWPGLVSLSPEQVTALRPEPSAPEDGPTDLSQADHALMEVLSRDGRAGFGELADATGWSESTVRRRMDHLRRTGILRFEVDLPPSALGYRGEARLWMSVRPSALVLAATALAGHPEVSFAAVTTGRTNLMAAVICEDHAGLYRYLTERVASLEGVDHVEMATVDRTVKRAGSVLPSAAFRGAVPL